MRLLTQNEFLIKNESEVYMKKKLYETPRTQHVVVELEEGLMKASVFEGGKENADGVTIEEHGFANPGAAWEGDYSDDTWD